METAPEAAQDEEGEATRRPPLWRPSTKFPQVSPPLKTPPVKHVTLSLVVVFLVHVVPYPFGPTATSAESPTGRHWSAVGGSGRSYA